MKHTNKPLNLILKLSFITCITTCYQLQLANADELINSCNHCHDGLKKDVPVISGISELSLEAGLLAYLDDSRKARPYDGKDMKSITEKLSEDQIKSLIAHYSAQKFTPVKQEIDSALAQTGKKLHDSYCEKCHTENGSLADDDSSILAGQWQGYLIEEMKHYKNGSRSGDKKMIDAIKSLSDEHIKALAAFYASQQ